MSNSTAVVGVVSTNREPQFATVTLLSADESEKTTFRVPITGDTTVRQLAKEAMRRFVMSRRHPTNGSSLPAVTQVYVGGHSTQPSAELFAHDVVTQVMLVKDEIVFMKLRDNSGVPATMKEVAHVEKPSTACAAAPVPTTVAQTEAPVVVVDGALKERAANVEHPAVRVEETKSKPQSVGKENGQSKPARPSAASRTTKTQKVQQPKGAEKNPKKEKKESPYAATKRGKRIEEAVDPAVAEIQERERKRMGWSSAYNEHFAPNYVSSPDKLFRAKRQRKTAAKEPPREAKLGEAVVAVPSQEADRKRERTEVEGRPTVAPKRACVARHIDFEDATDEKPRSGRVTVGHDVDLAGEDSPSEEESNASIPKGWGAQALKYFDPDTYCDNPAKAVLSSAILARPMHSRYAN